LPKFHKIPKKFQVIFLGIVSIFIFLITSVPFFAFTTAENLYSIIDARSRALAGASLENPAFSKAEFLRFSSGELYWDTPFQKVQFMKPGKISLGVDVSHFKTKSSDACDEIGEYGSFYQEETLVKIFAARRIRKFAFDSSLNFMTQTVFNSRGSAYSYDCGVSFAPFGDRIISKRKRIMPLFMGISFQNILSSPLDTGRMPEDLPKNFHLFLKSSILSGKISLHFRKSIMDMSVRKEDRFFSGIEVKIFPEIIIRFGKNDFETSYGAGLNIGRVNLDFASSVSGWDNRFVASISFDFSYVGEISEKLLKEKNKEIAALKKEIKEVKETPDSVTVQERTWLIKMISKAFKEMEMRNFSNARMTIKDVLSRYKYEANGTTSQISEEEAKKLVETAQILMGEKEYDKAKKCIATALNVIQGDQTAEEISHLADAYIQIEKGNYLLAKAILAEGLILKPDSVKILNLLNRVRKFIELTTEK